MFHKLFNYKEQVLNDANIRIHQLFDAWTQHLDDDVFAVESSSVDLSERCGGERGFLKAIEYGLQWPTQFGLDPPANLRRWEWRHSIMKLGELQEIYPRNDVRSNSEYL